jgi:hypothetical protein
MVIADCQLPIADCRWLKLSAGRGLNDQLAERQWLKFSRGGGLAGQFTPFTIADPSRLPTDQTNRQSAIGNWQ